MGGALTVTPTQDEATRQAAAAERIESLGGAIHGKDGRSKSLATRAQADAQKLVENAKALCKRPVKISWRNIKFEVEVKQNE